MILPKNKRYQKKKEKTCQYEGCGTIFFGIAVTKYCEKHRQDKYRIRKKPKLRPIHEENQLVHHSYTKATEIDCTCGLEGCSSNFSVTILPRQEVYPKYCIEHRNEFRRKQFLKSNRLAVLCGQRI